MKAGAGPRIVLGGVLLLAVAAVVWRIADTRRDPPVEPVPTADYATTPSVIEFRSAGRITVGKTITATAFTGQRLAVFAGDGTLRLAEWGPDGSLTAPTDPVPTGMAVAAAWTPDGLVWAEAGNDPAVVIRALDGASARLELEAQPVDLRWSGATLLALVRTQVDGEVIVIDTPTAMAGEVVLVEVDRHPVGRSPVGLFPAGDGFVIPAFVGRQVVVIARGGDVDPVGFEVPFRPVVAVQSAGAVFAAAGNAPTVEVVRDGEHATRTVSAPWTVAVPTDDGVLAFSASIGRLSRFEGDELRPVAEQDGFELVTGIVPTGDGRIVLIDAGATPRLALLDGRSLDLITEVPVEGRPSHVDVEAGRVLVTSPAEGVVSLWTY